MSCFFRKLTYFSLKFENSDHDGFVTKDELRTALIDASKASGIDVETELFKTEVEKVVQTTMELCDTQVTDGKISLSELLAAVKKDPTIVNYI